MLPINFLQVVAVVVTVPTNGFLQVLIIQNISSSIKIITLPAKHVISVQHLKRIPVMGVMNILNPISFQNIMRRESIISTIVFHAIDLVMSMRVEMKTGAVKKRATTIDHLIASPTQAFNSD
jgi:hypothetical protein